MQAPHDLTAAQLTVVWVVARHASDFPGPVGSQLTPEDSIFALTTSGRLTNTSLREFGQLKERRSRCDMREHLHSEALGTGARRLFLFLRPRTTD